jgi:hypothetical protein
MIRWSYHVEALHISERWWRRKRQTEELTRLNRRLNNLGSGGWEMVAYEATPMTGTFTYNIKGYAYLALFKQPQPFPGDDTSPQLDEEPAVQSEYSPVYEPLGAPFESQEAEPQEPEPQPVDATVYEPLGAPFESQEPEPQEPEPQPVDATVYEPLGAPFESQEPEPQEPEPQPADAMPESVRECEHAFCDQPAVPEKPGFCQRHLEELRLLFAAIEIRCPECGSVARSEAERQVRS